MERYVPSNGEQPSRRGYKRHEDPPTTPRRPFQMIVTTAAMVLVEHPGWHIDVSRFVTLSQPDHDERAVISGVLQALADAPDGGELVFWVGMLHDVPLSTLARCVTDSPCRKAGAGLGPAATIPSATSISPRTTTGEIASCGG